MVNMKSLALASLALVAAVSQAVVVVDINSRGTFTRTAGVYAVSDTNLTSDASSFAVTGFNLAYSYADAASSVANGGTFTSTAGSFTFTFDAGLGAATGTGVNRRRSMQGEVFSIANGTGIFAGLTGTGSISNHITYALATPNTGSTNSTFSVEAVPEPASMAALAIGIGAMLRRRRK